MQQLWLDTGVPCKGAVLAKQAKAPIHDIVGQPDWAAKVHYPFAASCDAAPREADGSKLKPWAATLQVMARRSTARPI
jgi:hypothetical protein